MVLRIDCMPLVAKKKLLKEACNIDLHIMHYLFPLNNFSSINS